MCYGIVAFSSMGTLALVRALRKLRLLCCQFCLMLVERNHGRPNSRGYAPRDSSDKTTAEISNKWPPMTMASFRSNPRGLTKRVFTMAQPERAVFPGCDAQGVACGFANDVYARSVVNHASLYFGAVH